MDYKSTLELVKKGAERRIKEVETIIENRLYSDTFELEWLKRLQYVAFETVAEEICGTILGGLLVNIDRGLLPESEWPNNQGWKPAPYRPMGL